MFTQACHALTAFVAIMMMMKISEYESKAPACM